MILYAGLFDFTHYGKKGKIMPKFEIGPFIQSIIVALIFFAIGRYIVIQSGGSGRWVIFAALIIFYAVWWVWYSRGRRKK